MFLVSYLSVCRVIIQLKISFENASKYSSEPPISFNVGLEAKNSIFEHPSMNNLLFFLNRRLKPVCFLLLSDTLLQYPHKHNLDLLVNHLIYPLDGLSKLPIFESILHELIEILQLDFLLSFDDLLYDVGELGLLKFMLFLIQDLFDVFVLIKEIIVAEFAALDLVSD